MALPTVSMRQLIESGVHFGHNARRWNPKMGQYIYGTRDGVHILDLTQTVPALYRAMEAIRDVAAKGGKVLFVGTKTQAREPIAEAAKRCGQYYVNCRWLGGMLTNWKTISASIKRLKEIDSKMEKGEFEGMTKKEKFHAVVDEIEKAHPDVFNILLQVLDDGHITDSQGRKVDFKNTIIIMTSNAGAQSIIEPKKLGFGAKEDEKQDHERMKASVMEEVKRIFKPEFLNRIDETIVFRALNKDDMKKIIGIMVRDLQKRCKEQLQIDLVVREAAKEFIVEKAYDRKYGARPLRRKLQDEVEDRLADALIRGEIHAKDRVIVTTKNKEIIVSKDKK